MAKDLGDGQMMWELGFDWFITSDIQVIYVLIWYKPIKQIVTVYQVISYKPNDSNDWQ